MNKDWVKQNSEKIKKAYSIALEKSYDIKSKETALKLLKVVDPNNATKENAEKLSKILQLFDKVAKKKVKRRSEVN